MDPFNFLLIALCLAFGFQRRSVWLPAAFALTASALHVAYAYSWWRKTGAISRLPERLGMILTLKVAIAFVAFGAGYAIRVVASRFRWLILLLPEFLLPAAAVK